MAGQPPPQGPEDDFFDQFFSMASGGSYTGAAAGGGRAAGDQPFSLALSLGAAAATASGFGKHADGGKADREAVQLPVLFPPVFGGGVQPPHLRATPPTQVFHAQQPKQGGAGVGPQPPAPRPKLEGSSVPEAEENCRPSFDLGSVPSSPPPLPISYFPFPPSLIPCSQWEKRECIGRGSVGQVYKGFNSEHGRFCAIKEVLVISNDRRSRDLLKQLNQEIFFLKQLSHPNIVQYYGTIMTDYALSIYMEYVSEGSIHALLAKYGPFEESMIRHYTVQILSGLAYLHERRHIHRDIKGANILVGPYNEVKLADFGLAKHIQTLTAAHTSCRGTPCWMAPEVFLSTLSGKEYNLSADIWSLGCTVIEMATEKPPLHGYEPAAAMFKIASNTYMPEIPDNLSDEGKNFLKLCLQRDPARRPSAAALVDHPFTRNQG